MSNKEIVQQGLQVRKDVRAAEIRAEKYRAEVDAANDARFRDQMVYRQAQRAWQYEREDLTGTISRQFIALRQMREEIGEMRKREREARQRRILISAVKAIILFAVLICIRDLGLIVTWLIDSLLAFSMTWLLFSVVILNYKKN